MGYKNTCLDCRKAFNRPLNTDANRVFKCPNCGNPTVSLSHLFQPPPKDDLKGCAVVKLLVDNVFTYNHVYLKTEMKNGVVTSYSGYAEYPENLRDEEKFIKKYQEQIARK